MTTEPLTGKFTGLAQQVADHVLHDAAAGCPQIVIGPVVWQPCDTGRQWYFAVASAGADGFRTDRVLGDDRALTERTREALLFSLIQRRPIVVHDIDDELEMARWCAAIWPGPKTAKIVATIEAERMPPAGRA